MGPEQANRDKRWNSGEPESNPTAPNGIGGTRRTLCAVLPASREARFQKFISTAYSRKLVHKHGLMTLACVVELYIVLSESV